MSDMSMEPPGLVYITKSAVRVIEEEARRQSEGGQFKHETGGILIGRRLGFPNHRELLIVAATRPGAAALHSAEEFNPDVDYVNQHLREYLAIYPKMDYIGVWHQHPPEYPIFSAGDVQSAQALCTDDDYHAREVVNPIVWIRDSSFTIRYYYMNRDMATRQLPFVQIDGASLCLVDDDHPLIQAEKTRPGSAPAPSQRVEEERQRLARQGYAVQIGAENRYTYLTFQNSYRPDLILYAIIPPNYPKDTPVLAVEQSGRKVEFDQAALWAAAGAQGVPYLADLAHTLAAQIPAPPERITGRLAPTHDADTKRITGRLALVDDHGANRTALSAGIQRLSGWSSRMAPLILGLVGIMVVAASATTAWLWDAQGGAELAPIVAINPTAIGTSTSKTAAITLSTSGTPQSELALQWQKVEAASTLEQQIDRIEELRQAGVQRDPSGTPTADRLLKARMQYAAELAAEGTYDRAIDIARLALAEAPASSKQQAANQLAGIYLSAGDSALKQRDFASAILYYQEIEKIPPKPSADQVAQAKTKLESTKQDAEDRAKLAEAWREYGNTSSLKSKIELIENQIEPITTWKPDPAKFPVQFYNSNTLKVAELWGQHCLDYARILQRPGDLNTARAYFAKVQQSPDVPADFRSQAETGIKNVDSALYNWNIVNRSSSTNQDRISALKRLQNLPGFGPGAQKPIGGPNVAALLAALQTTPTAPAPTPTEPLILIPPPEATGEPSNLTPMPIPATEPPTTPTEAPATGPTPEPTSAP